MLESNIFNCKLRNYLGFYLLIFCGVFALCHTSALRRLELHAFSKFLSFHSSVSYSRLRFRWLPGDWSECSASCGGGHQTRDVFCVESHPSRHWNATPEAESSLTSLYNTSTATVWDDLENWKVADQYCWQLQKPVSF